MFLNNSADQLSIIILIIVCGAILLVGLIIFLSIFLKRTSIRRKVKKVIDKWEYLHSLLISQDATYVRRLEIISRSNLLYTDIHSKFHVRYRELSSKKDSTTQTEINRLRDNLDLKKYKEIYQDFDRIKAILDDYEKEVTKFNEDLLTVIKPEEDCRQACVEVKEKIRSIKNQFYAKQNSLDLVSSSFDAVFTKLDDYIQYHDSLVDSANYEEATEQLHKIRAVANELDNVIKVMPNLCALADEILPRKIQELSEAYRKMIEKEFPLHHLLNKNTIIQLHQQLKKDINRIKNFDIAGVEDNLNQIIKICDDFINSFEKEINDRDSYNNNCSKIYQKVTDIENECIRLCNSIPRIENYYKISDASYKKMEEIQQDINNLSNSKRAFDTFIHNVNMQPYSILVSKMNELNDDSDKIDLKLRDFNAYLNSLKNDSEVAFELIFSYYSRIKEIERKIRDANLPILDKKYKENIDYLYILLDSINTSLNILPINVEEVNKYVEELKQKGDELIGQINKDVNLIVMAETSILYANRDRHHLNDVHIVVKQSEQLFFEGEFEKSYVQTGDLLKRFRDENSDK